MLFYLLSFCCELLLTRCKHKIKKRLLVIMGTTFVLLDSTTTGRSCLSPTILRCLFLFQKAFLDRSGGGRVKLTQPLSWMGSVGIVPLQIHHNILIFAALLGDAFRMKHVGGHLLAFIVRVLFGLVHFKNRPKKKKKSIIR